MNETETLKSEKTATNTGAGEVMENLKVADVVVLDSVVTIG